MKPLRKSRPPLRSTRAELEDELRQAQGQLDDRRGRLEQEALRQAQREVEASREEFIELYDYSPVGHLTLDHNGLIRTLNLTTTELLGRSRKDLIGRPLQALISAGDRRRFLNLLSRLRRGLDHASAELELLRHNGPPVAVQLVSVARSGNRTHPLEYRTALVDITERKRAEARTAALARLGLLLSAATEPAAAARALVETAQELCGWDACFVLLHDPATDTVIDLVNMDTLEGRRVAVPPVLRGRPPSPLVRRVMQEGPELILRPNPEDKGPTTTRFGDTSRPALSLMFVPILLEGRSIGVLSLQSYQPRAYGPQHLKTLQDLAANVAGALARLQAQAALRQRTAELEAANEHLRQEIAQRQAAEQDLLLTAEELKRSNRDLDQFAAIASHDLQEPLRAVNGYLGLLKRRLSGHLDPKALEYVSTAVEGGTRMEKMIAALLNFSRVATSAAVLAPADLGALLADALESLRPAIKTAGATVTRDAMPRLSVDAIQITRLFQNLIGNALKFRGVQPPQIHVGARRQADRWEFRVQDNGIGIEPEHFGRIFQIFQRLHTQAEYPGTGMGLAICKRIVERHGGTIWLESQPGQGATFYFSLPAEAAPPASTGAASAAQATGTPPAV